VRRLRDARGHALAAGPGARAAMTEPEEYVPIGERCYRGCRRRAVVREELSLYCARCYLALVRARVKDAA
ncbi:MAG TPA: hypothetical protein VGR43_00250, partial [Dehalococcoidia bacterium]|nr:hypothetical protein [Dehalococcoidia bacterium]